MSPLWGCCASRSRAPVLHHATSEFAIGSKLGIDTTNPDPSGPGEGVMQTWPPLIKMDEAVKVNAAERFNPQKLT